MKRTFDIIFSILLLMLISPLLILISFLIWNQDKSYPLYIAERIGFKGKVFKIIKLRTMVVNADRSGVDSTSSNDPRITNIGHFIRKLKLDEFTQFFNILKGEMSLVGPRPNVIRDVNLYTNIEKRLLSVKPGITDFSSVIFADEAEILKDKLDPDISYNQLIRPWKSRLGLFYIDKRNFLIDILLVLITGINIFSRKTALFFTTCLLKYLRAPNNLIKISKRKNVLQPFPPPGSDNIIKSRDL